MPQLDLSTFVHQCFWVVLFFYLSFLLINEILPDLLMVLKIRNKLEKYNHNLIAIRSKNLPSITKHFSGFFQGVTITTKNF